MTIAKAEVRLVGKDATASAFRSVIRNAEAAQRQISTKLRSAFNLLGAGAGIYGLTRAVSGAIKAGDDLAKFAQKSGLAAESASELAHAAKMVDVDLGQLAIGVRNTQRQISEAASGNKTAQRTFDDLGVSWRDLQKLAPDKQLEVVADALAAVPDPADRARLGTELLARSWDALAPLLLKGAAGIRAAREEARQLGKSFSASDLKRFQEADDALKKLKASGSALADELTIRLSPALVRASESLRTLFGRQTDEEKLIEELRLAELGIASLGKMINESPNGAEALERYAKALEALTNFRIGRTLELTAGQGQPGARSSSGLGPEAEKARRELMAMGDPVQQLTAKFEAQKVKVEELVKAYPELAAVAGSVIQRLRQEHLIALDEIAAATSGLSDIARESEEAYLAQPLGPSMQENAAAIAATMHEINAENIELRERTIQVGEAFKEAEKNAQGLMATIQDELSRRALGTLSDLIYNMGRGAKNFGDQMLDAFRRILADQAAKQIIALLSGLGGGGGGGGFLGAIASGIGALFGGRSSGGGGGGGARFGGFMAAGGTLRPGEFGVVGERGPELALGGMHGQTIVPMNRGGKAARQVVATYAPVYHFASGVSRAEIEPLLNQRDRANQAQFLAFFRDQLSRGAFA